MYYRIYIIDPAPQPIPDTNRSLEMTIAFYSQSMAVLFRSNPDYRLMLRNQKIVL